MLLAGTIFILPNFYHHY